MGARRIRKTKINLWPVAAALVFAAIVTAVVYLLLLKPSTITCGIFLEKRVGNSTIDVKLGYGDKVKWIKVSKRLGLPLGDAYDVQLKGIVVHSIKACRTYDGKVYAFDRQKGTVELEYGVLKLAPSVKYYKITDKGQQLVSPNTLLLGTTGNKFIEDHGLITAVIVGKPDLEKLRVGLSTKLRSRQVHKDIILYSKRILTVSYGDTTLKIKDFAFGISYKNNAMELIGYDQNGNGIKFRKLYGRTKERIVVYSDYDFEVPISFRSFDFEDELREPLSFPNYYGSLEFTLMDRDIRAVNEVDLNSYVSNVVKSQLNSLGDYPTACSVQAVMTRTGTVSEILSGRNSKNGYHVVDINPNQVYNPEKLKDRPEEITNAIDITSDQIMTYDGIPIDTRTYSTSCGVGTPYSDVWFEGNLPPNENSKPYLTFGNYSKVKVTSLSTESDASNFLKDWTIKAYDSNSKYFRWKYNIDLSTLSKAINTGIYKCWKDDKSSFTKKWYFNIYRNCTIPPSGIGKITDVSITKRGIGGNILELGITAESGEYRITHDTNIKRLLISKDVTIDFLYGNDQSGFNTPPSSFFVIEKESSKQFTVYGGGYGHGVGLSQYGVVGMIRANKDYKNILKTFYRSVTYKNWNDSIQNSYKNGAVQ